MNTPETFNRCGALVAWLGLDIFFSGSAFVAPTYRYRRYRLSSFEHTLSISVSIRIYTVCAFLNKNPSHHKRLVKILTGFHLILDL